jgi:hypothetical protein
MLAVLIPLLAPIIKSLIDRIPDPAAREKAEAETNQKIIEAFLASNQAQVEVNKAEAASGRGGWRWGMGWLCVISLGYAWVARDLLAWAVRLVDPSLPPPPGLDVAEQYTIVTGMLGLAGVRAYDLQKGSRT